MAGRERAAVDGESLADLETSWVFIASACPGTRSGFDHPRAIYILFSASHRGQATCSFSTLQRAQVPSDPSRLQVTSLLSFLEPLQPETWGFAATRSQT